MTASTDARRIWPNDALTGAASAIEATIRTAAPARIAGTQERRAQGDRIVPNVKSRTAPPEQGRRGEAPQGLLEVEPFHEVEEPECEEERDRDVERAPAPAVEVERG